jgi:uncharacterized protein (DUF885 family)
VSINFAPVVALLAAVTMATPADTALELDRSSSEMRSTIERYTVDRDILLRRYQIEVSPARRERLARFHKESLDALSKLNFDSMSAEGRIDYLLFRNHLQHEIRLLDLQDKADGGIAPLAPFSKVIIGLDESRRRMEAIDARKAAATLDALAKEIADTNRSLETSLRTSPVKKTDGAQAAIFVTTLRATLRNWFEFYNGYDPLFTWWAAEPFKSADSNLQSYATFLRQRVAGVRSAEPVAAAGGAGVAQRRRGDAGGPPANRPSTAVAAAQAGSSDDIVGIPIGREGLMAELAHEMITYTPEELIAIANKELAWCEDQMKRASRELGFGEDWRKALEHVKNLYVEPGKQPTLIRDLANEAIAFIDEFNLITVPALARETWRIEMMSPERQLINPFFTGGEVISVSYPVPSMTSEQKLMSMRGNNIHFSRATVHHELIPGHHLQGFMAQRYHRYRQLFRTPFYGEGWSLYWELLLWDKNFAKTPEDRVGFLFWRMHRCARIIFSLSFHLEKMTPQECIELLVNRVGHERENAIAEVRRSFAGTDGPLYQAAYLLGGLQIRAMRKELVEAGKMTDREFHDAILKENSIPIEMVRASLTKQKLGRDFNPSWKFYGPLN